MPLMTFLFSIMHTHLVFFYLSYHSSINICLQGVWLKDAAMLYGGHTAGKHIFMSAISYLCKSLVSAHIFATVDCKHLKTQFCIAKCAQHFILAGFAACISTISLYMLVQNIGNKGASIPPVFAGEDALRITFWSRIKCLVSHMV